MPRLKHPCSVCNRRQGCTKDLGGHEDGIPLGPVTKCDPCGRWACPDCLHEADCCFTDYTEGEGGLFSRESPPGWKRLDEITFIREDANG